MANDEIVSARDQRIDVVLVDTAGRMQDNEPLMRALSKVTFLYFFHPAVRLVFIPSSINSFTYYCSS